MLSPDFNLYADTQQTINLALVEAFAARRIKIALPAQTNIVRHVGAAAQDAEVAEQDPARPAAEPS